MAKHSPDVTDSSAVEAPDLESAAAAAPRHGFFVRLYTGTGAFDVVGRRTFWYSLSGLIVAVAIASILIRGFTFGIDFEGGTKVSMPVTGAHGTVSTEQVEGVFSETIGKPPESVVIVGSGDSATAQIRSETLTNEETERLRTALFDAFQPKGSDGQPSKQAISDSAVSETWGGQITNKALIALVVFLLLAAIYITVRYERYMAIAALATLVFDLVTTAGVYSLVGFEVTPATVIGLLTILGFSLYDTIVVFDKVEENTQGFEHTTRRTFAEQANLAINQTDLGPADRRADGDRGLAARGRHPDGSGAGAARRRDRRHLLVDLLRHPAAGVVTRAHRKGAHPHATGSQPPQAARHEDRRSHRRRRARDGRRGQQARARRQACPRGAARSADEQQDRTTVG
jgi:preprotein translocase SecF subunit